MFPSAMMGMLPPAAQALIDALPQPSELEDAVGLLRHQHDVVGATRDKVATFLELLAQVMKQQGLAMEVEAPTEPLRLECPECHMAFAVDSPMGYFAGLTNGKLYACANGHQETIVGSGRLGELTGMEQEAYGHDERSVEVIYGGDSTASVPESTDS